ncbi:MAG: phosphate ABC transporter permease PstA [Bacteroidales bacterium]|nr:phosphate ABC transporter permease PstA [Bacteroidales bacterium]
MNIKTRIAKDRIQLWTVCFFAALTAVPLLAIIGEVVIKGFGQISWSFLTEPTPTAYKAMKAVQAGEPIPGGIANGIVGTLIMVGMAAIVAIPVGILCGAFLAENSKKRSAVIISFLTDLLQGTPSIIIGIITYIWVVVPMKGYSAIAGSGALFIMMLPLIIRSTEETLKILPTSLQEAGLALGANRASVMLRIQLPAAFGGIFKGVLLSISRVTGETAPLLFTALGCSFIRWSINKPISAVPLLIWEFFNDPHLQDLIWGASFFLLLFVLTLNLTAKYIAKKWNQ